MIYLDYNATTPIDPEVSRAMQPMLNEIYGNPSSIHNAGLDAKKAIEKARKQLAELIHCRPSELIFTSGGTESNNLAIQGIARALRDKGRHLIISAVEHPAVSEVCKYLENEGYQLSTINVDETGWVDPTDIEQAIRPDTILISIMHANNEVGTIQDIEAIGKMAKSKGVVFHCDAAQSIGKIAVDVETMGVDLLSIAGHKFYGPKGVGALYIRPGTPLQKLMFGANHEQNIRPGTENVPEIAGLGKAAELARRDLKNNRQHYAAMRDLLWNGLKSALPGIRRNGHPEQVLPNTLSVSFPGIEANTLVSRLDNLAVSAGAACHAEQIDVSTVLEAMKLPVRYAMGTIRFSTGKYNTESAIEQAVQKVISVVNKLNQTGDITTVDSTDIKLTRFTHGLGCACKIEPKKLESILRKIPTINDPKVLVGMDTSDDASVYQLTDELAIVQTLDFFTPIVDDPYDFGAIAAANALSDLYAMGSKPLFGQNIVGFPEHVLPMQVLEQILIGAADKAKEAGIPITGGHTIEDPEPKYGMVVTGMIHPKKFIPNNGAKPGDLLILTKPIGTGILSTALKRGLLEQSTKDQLIQTMSTLNNIAAETMVKYRVHACTDVTGFGLLGHLLEMSKGSKCDVSLQLDKIPLLAEVESLVASGIVPGGTLENLSYVKSMVDFKNTPTHLQQIIADAQTSGGLLISVHPEDADNLLQELKSKINTVALIGKFTSTGTGRIKIEI